MISAIDKASVQTRELPMTVPIVNMWVTVTRQCLWQRLTNWNICLSVWKHTATNQRITWRTDLDNLSHSLAWRPITAVFQFTSNNFTACRTITCWMLGEQVSSLCRGPLIMDTALWTIFFFRRPVHHLVISIVLRADCVIQDAIQSQTLITYLFKILHSRSPRPTGWHSYFVFGKSLVHISALVAPVFLFSWFYSVPPS